MIQKNIVIEGMGHAVLDGVFDCFYCGKYRSAAKTLVLGCGVRIGDVHNYGAYQNKLEDTYNIAVRNVVSRSKNAVEVVGGLSDSVIENIKWFYCEGEYGRSNYTNANFVNCKTNE